MRLWKQSGGNGAGLRLTGKGGGVAIPVIFTGSTPVGARAYNNADQALTTGVWTPLALNSELWDNDTCHDLVTNNSRLTCHTAGTYSVKANVLFAANATGIRGLMVRVNAGGNPVNGTCIAEIIQNATSASYTGMALDTDYVLAVGDYVELFAYQSSGGNLNASYFSAYSPQFSMVRIV